MAALRPDRLRRRRYAYGLFGLTTRLRRKTALRLFHQQLLTLALGGRQTKRRRPRMRRKAQDRMPWR